MPLPGDPTLGLQPHRHHVLSEGGSAWRRLEIYAAHAHEHADQIRQARRAAA